MYYNVVVKDKKSENYSWDNELIFHFGNDLQRVLSFCEMILDTSNNSVEILPFIDYESEE